MEQIKIFLAGFACILALAAMIVSSVCAFIEGNALTVISGIINAAIGTGLFVYVMKNYFGRK